jgi:hypothetical protein
MYRDFDENSASVHFMVDVKDEQALGSSRYLTLAMGAVLVDANGTIRNPSRSYRSDPHAKWADFQVAAQLDDAGGADWYGRRVQYREVFTMELADAEMMAKHLRSLHRKLERLDAKFGSVTDFAGFMGRVADASGCEERPFVRKVNEGPGFGYDDNEYRFMTTDDLRWHLTEKVRAWREKHGITVAS